MILDRVLGVRDEDEENQLHHQLLIVGLNGPSTVRCLFYIASVN